MKLVVQQMRQHMIQLTDSKLFPRLIKILQLEEEPIYPESIKWDEGWDRFMYDGGEWIHNKTRYNSPPCTITDSYFIHLFEERKNNMSFYAEHLLMTQKVLALEDLDEEDQIKYQMIAFERIFPIPPIESEES